MFYSSLYPLFSRQGRIGQLGFWRISMRSVVGELAFPGSLAARDGAHCFHLLEVQKKNYLDSTGP
jgi:hypothetical protein